MALEHFFNFQTTLSQIIKPDGNTVCIMLKLNNNLNISYIKNIFIMIFTHERNKAKIYNMALLRTNEKNH